MGIMLSYVKMTAYKRLIETLTIISNKVVGVLPVANNLGWLTTSSDPMSPLVVIMQDDSGNLIVCATKPSCFNIKEENAHDRLFGFEILFPDPSRLTGESDVNPLCIIVHYRRTNDLNVVVSIR